MIHFVWPLAIELFMGVAVISSRAMKAIILMAVEYYDME